MIILNRCLTSSMDFCRRVAADGEELLVRVAAITDELADLRNGQGQTTKEMAYFFRSSTHLVVSGDHPGKGAKCFWSRLRSEGLKM